jgi:uncharacterized protein YndB with AHSA1/START domain
MSKPIRKEAFYPDVTPEQVWVALTDRRAIAEWLMPNDFSPVVGHKFRFQIDPMPMCDVRVDCEVLTVDRPRKLAFTWMPTPRSGPLPAGTRPSVVTWTLSPEASGTRLTLEHEGVERVYPWLQRFLLRFGWGTIVKSAMRKVARNVDASGQFTPGAFPVEKRCYKCKTIPAELTR